MKKKKIIIAWLMLASCMKTVNLDLPVHEPRLVLHGYVAVGEFFEVTIGKSVNPAAEMNSDMTWIDNAWVVLYENGAMLDSLRYDARGKKYRSQSVVAGAGKTYTIKAGASGFPAVETTATASFPVNTIFLKHEKQTRITHYGEWMDDIQFSFQDAAGQENFYLTAVFPSEYARVGLQCVYSGDPVIERTQGNNLPFDESACLPNKHILFSDRSFNGSAREFTLGAASKSMETAADPQGNLHRPYLKRYSISEDYYRYLKKTLSVFSGGDLPSFNEPVIVKGNVKNGYGLFAVFSVATDTLR